MLPTDISNQRKDYSIEHPNRFPHLQPKDLWYQPVSLGKFPFLTTSNLFITEYIYIDTFLMNHYYYYYNFCSASSDVHFNGIINWNLELTLFYKKSVEEPSSKDFLVLIKQALFF